MEANDEKTGLYGTVKLLFAHKKNKAYSHGVSMPCWIGCYKILRVDISVSGVLLDKFAAWFYVVAHQH